MYRKGVEETVIGTIILLIIIGVSVFMLFILPIWSEIPTTECIMAQFANLRRLDNPRGSGIVQKANLTKKVTNVDLHIMYCVDCMWYDPTNSKLIMQIHGEPSTEYWNVSATYLNIGYDCGNCETGTDEKKCANLRKDTTYILTVNATHANCTHMIVGEETLPCPESSNPYK